jgi:Arm DNA-binding domain
MPKTRLTELTITRAKLPKEGRLELWDTTLPAFGLRISSSGGRSWIVALRKPGARHPARVKLGEPPLMSLSEAREKARAMLQDPVGISEARHLAQSYTVRVAVTEYVDRYQQPRNRGWHEVQQVLERELLPWNERPITDIRRSDILRLLDIVADRASPARANRVLAYLRRMFNWCVERGILEASPVAAINRLAAKRAVTACSITTSSPQSGTRRTVWAGRGRRSSNCWLPPRSGGTKWPEWHGATSTWSAGSGRCPASLPRPTACTRFRCPA